MDPKGRAGLSEGTHVRQGQRNPTPMAQAWTALALVPVFFGMAVGAMMLVTELAPPDPNTRFSPMWADLVALVLGLTILLLPCIAAVVYGRKAVLSGKRSGAVPVLVGVLVGGAAALVAFLLGFVRTIT